MRNFTNVQDFSMFGDFEEDCRELFDANIGVKSMATDHQEGTDAYLEEVERLKRIKAKLFSRISESIREEELNMLKVDPSALAMFMMDFCDSVIENGPNHVLRISGDESCLQNRFFVRFAEKHHITKVEVWNSNILGWVILPFMQNNWTVRAILTKEKLSHYKLAFQLVSADANE